MFITPYSYVMDRKFINKRYVQVTGIILTGQNGIEMSPCK